MWFVENTDGTCDYVALRKFDFERMADALREAVAQGQDDRSRLGLCLESLIRSFEPGQSSDALATAVTDLAGGLR